MNFPDQPTPKKSFEKPFFLGIPVGKVGQKCIFAAIFGGGTLLSKIEFKFQVRVQKILHCKRSFS